jgi:uncharacterized protein YjbI with pentapeptide repeats
MLKHIATVIVTAGLFASLAQAQDMAQIENVKAGKSCSGCNLFQANFAYLDGAKLDLSGTRLRQSDLALSTFDDINLSDADLSIANLFGARFNRTNFSRANLRNAIAVGTYFGASDFSGADLTGVNFSGANLASAKNLTQAQLNTACGDQSTRLPRGMTLPRCAPRQQ